MADLFACLDARKPRPAVLYLGLNPPPSLLQSYQVVHYPVIKILPAPMTNPDVQNALLKLSQFTHLIFTSKTAVDLFFRYVQGFYGDSRILQDKRILAIGQSTASALKREGLPPHAVAEEETSEGVVALLGKDNLDRAKILWPHSALSRPVIADYLRERNIPFTECNLYTTHSYCAEPLPDLNAVQEIIFTSPSTVDGFCAIFGALPKDKTLTCIGPITEAYLKSVACKSV
jgi:uroporphyrinogen-III synthase